MLRTPHDSREFEIPTLAYTIYICITYRSRYPIRVCIPTRFVDTHERNIIILLLPSFRLPSKKDSDDRESTK